ncbi:hypothetical protein NJB14197_48340 [Mycobacterium montefiorense]|uniref:Uncharacterized protein n=1 Tax=Mycobacterium montefiorense TaxID=154654 RepID=A0AA37PSX4_9MYCO|nr:hypothetical protein MmonteBS_39350 [Mycobacterium montefiorense]GKU34728.1 hypothetical protein NJB14191_20740 [Mycobacterium montefiorense]GKU42406.1 hypothetical protein NJB14192_43890 [Mycobacterium montefiorense]GKU46015.1 hypothetical protein NJB14194_26350 [Mycobacterium montefiorense]GKU52034.1 hypothetical protein NJB14195_32780 [Mycobacterium montefiorense]
MDYRPVTCLPDQFEAVGAGSDHDISSVTVHQQQRTAVVENDCPGCKVGRTYVARTRQWHLGFHDRRPSADLLRSGIVDAIVPEPPDAADEPIEFSPRLPAAIAAEVPALREVPGAERISERLRRYRGIGLP